MSIVQAVGVEPVPPGDTTAPVLNSVTVNSSQPARIILTYSETLDASKIPAIAAFTVANKTVTAISLSAGLVYVDVSSGYSGGNVVNVSYAQPGTNALQDAAGNKALSFSNQTFTLPAGDTTPPALSSVFISAAAPDRVVLTYSEALDTSKVPAIAAYTFSAGRTGSSVSISGADVTVIFTPSCAPGTTITVAYAQPGTNALQDLAGNKAASFAAQSFSLAATGTEQQLTFATRTSNITEDSTGLTATSPVYTNTYALADYYIPAGTDGYMVMSYLSTNNRNVLMGLNTSALNEQFAGYEYYTWLGGSLGDIKHGQLADSNQPSTGINAAINSKLRIGRFSGVLKVQYASTGANWTDVKVWGADSSLFYLCVAMQGTKMSDPKVLGGVVR